MSSGIFYHCYFGKTRREVYNNKYVLEVEYDKVRAASWAKKYMDFKSSYLTTKQVQFVLFPEEIQHKKQTQNAEETQNDSQKLTVIYDHYVVSLEQELRHRIEYRNEFSIGELWYWLCCLVNGGIELTQVHNLTNIYEQPIINSKIILLNDYGMVKIVGDLSSPLVLPKDPCFETPTKERDLLAKKNLLSATYSMGRVMASLIMLKQLEDFNKEGVFDLVAFKQELIKHKQRLGLLYNIVIGMLQGLPDQRILLHQISALLYPYQGCMLKLQSFRLDRSLCQYSMLSILLKSS